MDGGREEPVRAPRNRAVMRPPTILATALCALALGACGSSTTTVTETTPSRTAQGPVTTTATHTSATASSTTATSATATASSTGRRCVAAELHGVFLGQQGAAGHGEFGFALRNASAHTCHTFGYPGVQFVNDLGVGLPTVSTRTTHDLFGTTTVAGIDLAPGQEASFRVGVDHGFAAGSKCANAVGVNVIPPDDTANLFIGIPGRGYECGRATVSPLQPGTSAYR